MANVASCPLVARRSSLRERRGRLQPLDGDCAQRVSQLPHVRRSADSLPYDVTYDEPEPAVAQLEGVEPVSTDVDTLRAGQVARRYLDPGDARQRGGQDAALKGLRRRALRLEVPGPVERLRSLTPESLEEAAIVVAQGDRLRPAELEDANGAPARDERHGESRARDSRSRRVRRLEPRSTTSQHTCERGTVLE